MTTLPDDRLPLDGAHTSWLAAEADRLLTFYERAVVDPAGGFHWLDDGGRPLPGQAKHLWLTARMIHCFAIAELLGRPGAGPIVDHGLEFLRGPLEDSEHGGWFWAVGDPEQLDTDKHAYGHAFVLLAASSASVAGHAGADRLLDDALNVLTDHFWEPVHERFQERFSADWTWSEPYRGGNSHMHLVEALMAASDATGDDGPQRRAAGIAERLLGGAATKDGWRLAEHFDADWTPDHEYNAENPDNEFRPYGSTIGHWLEWARLLVLLHAYDPRRRQWMVDAADSLFDHAVTEGWEPDGGFAFTVDWDGRPLSRDRYHWVVAEAIGAACALHQRTRRDDCRDWYQRFWAYANQYLIDHDRGGWRHQLDPDHQPIDTVWTGKPDLYHALQATLFARVPLDVGLAVALRDGRLDDVSPPSPR